jgi:hypothetical protein
VDNITDLTVLAKSEFARFVQNSSNIRKLIPQSKYNVHAEITGIICLGYL